MAFVTQMKLPELVLLIVSSILSAEIQFVNQTKLFSPAQQIVALLLVVTESVKEMNTGDSVLVIASMMPIAEMESVKPTKVHLVVLIVHLVLAEIMYVKMLKILACAQQIVLQLNAEMVFVT